VLPLRPISGDDRPHPLYLPVHKRGMASLVSCPWVTFACRREFSRSLMDSSEEHLVRKLEEGLRFPLHVDRLDHLELMECALLQGRRHHDSRSPNNDQGGGRAVGDCRRQKSMVFSVGGVASCHPSPSMSLGCSASAGFVLNNFSLLNIKIYNPLVYLRKKSKAHQIICFAYGTCC